LIVRKRVFKKKRSAGARPFSEPRDLTELLQQVERHVAESLGRYSHWTESDALKKAPTTRVGKTRRSRIGAARDKLKSVARAAKAMAVQLEVIASDESNAPYEPPMQVAESRSRSM
jgi:hypothetical protein